MWEELYRRHYPELLKYCIAACRDRELAEDLAQETFLKALQNPDTMEDLGPSQRRAWLFRTMKNLFCDRYRRAVLESQHLQTMDADAAYTDPGIQRVENEQVLSALAPEDRVLFRLRYIEDYNATEISEMLGIPTGTIRSRLSRCRKLLKESMKI